MIETERKTIADLVLRFPAERANESALVFLDVNGNETNSFSFAGLREFVLSAAYYLYNADLVGKRVPVITSDPGEFVIAFFGCVVAGMIPVPLPAPKNRNDRSTFELLGHVLEENEAPLLLGSNDSCQIIEQCLQKESAKFPTITPIAFLQQQKARECNLPAVESDSVAYLQYTSGSTLDPKGVVLRHSQVLQNLAQMYRVFDRKERVRVAGWIPFHHDMGLVGHLFTVLYESGFGVFMPPTAFLAKPELWLSAIARYRANSAAAPNFAFDYCTRKIRQPFNFDLSCWKYVYVGSETVYPATLDGFYQKFKEAGFIRNSFKPVYGLAEVTLLAAGGGMGFEELDGFSRFSSDDQQQRQLIAYSIEPEMKVSIHGNDGSELAENTVGEIWLSGPSVAVGYASATDADLIFQQSVRTGDIGFVSNGFVYITGRSKDVVILRGINYSAEDLEFASRRSLELIASNDLTACTTHLGSTRESLFVFQEVHRHLSAEQREGVARHINQNLAQAFGVVADEIILVPSGFLPRTRNNKLSRQRCMERYLAGELQVLYQNKQASEPARTANTGSDDVAVVGMSCRFPGGVDTPDKFWELLAGSRDAVSEVPGERWDNELFYDPRAATPGKMNTRWAGFIDKIDSFDAALFGISPFEAPEIDPQQRLLLETSWRLLENAGWQKDSLAGSDTGVFIGISTNDYLYMKIKLLPGMDSFNAYSGLGNANSVAANRISYFYDLKGPSMAVDTACSSSLTAFHLGVAAIQNGDCKQAIVGGVNAILSPGPCITLSQFGMMSPTGHCKTFDADADGYVRAEGCGMVMLKKHADAIRDGDRVLAIVRGSAAGQDGNSAGITFPNATAQRKLIEKCLSTSGVKPSEIGYIEAHGTGTAAGDPVEMEQLVKVYGAGDANCFVGSVKANLGHLEAAAGIASVIKVLLMLEKSQIPPQLHFKKLNPKINLKGSRLNIPTELTPWKKKVGTLAKAAISSFGFGGSLAHVILEAPGVREEDVAPANSLSRHTLFVFSAQSSESLSLQAGAWIKWLDENPSISIHDICFSQASARSHLRYRHFLLVDSPQMLRAKLAEFVRNGRLSGPLTYKPVFLFTGQGEYYRHMGLELYRHYPPYATAFDRCAAAINEKLEGYSLQELAFGSADLFNMGSRFMQPVTFAVQYALAILLENSGCLSGVLLGHSLGEYVAACLAGCFTPETGMLMVWKRGELIDRFCPSGKMAVIFCEASRVEAEITASKCSIAAINSPSKTVISGDTAEITRLIEHFREIGIQHADVKSQFAFHSYQMDAVVEPFMEYLQQFSFRAPSRTWVSCSNGNSMEHAPGAEHWAKHLRDTVNFRQAAVLLEKLSPKQIIEIGPGSGTLYSVSENFDCSGIALLRTMNFKKGDRTELYFVLDTLGQLFRSGMDLRPQAIPSGGKFPQLIPGLSFSQTSYWLEGLNAGAVSAFANHHANTTKMAETPPNKPKLHFDLQWEQTDISFAETIALNESVKDINWIVIGDGTPLAESLVTRLHHHKAYVFHIATPAQSKKTLLPDIVVSPTADKSEWRKALDTIVNFKSRVNITDWRMIWVTGNRFDAANESAAENLNSPLRLLFPLLQALEESIPVLRLWIVTEKSQLVTGVNQDPIGLNLPAASTWGFAKTLFLEHPEWRGGMIDTDLDPLDTELILKKISKPGVGAESCVALRSGRQYIQKINNCENYPVDVAALRTDGIYLITGGLGGLGLATAGWLADKGVRHLMLLGRRSFPKPHDWESVSPEDPAYQLIEEMRRLSARGVTVEVVQGDVRDVQLLKRLFSSIDERKIPLRGVIHAAGVNWFSKIMQMDGKQLHTTLEIKTNATWALHEMTAGRDLDCFVLFSSVSALWGSVELSHYTAANHFLDMLSQYRHAMGLKSCSINWGPWAEAGMSAGPREKEVLSKLGFRLLATKDAIDAMDRVVACSQPLTLIAEVDWNKFRVFTDFSLQPSLFSALTHVDVNEKRSRQGVVEFIRSQSPEKARILIEEYVRTELRMVMLIESIDTIDSDQRFNFLGMDSLMAITFVVQLEELFECKLPTTLVYNYPTIKSVCDYLFDDIYGSGKRELDQEAVTEHQEQALHACRKILKGCELSEKVTLFCFPYAGSGASAYMPWPSHFNGNLEIVAMQPPGREDRSNEPPFASMTQIVAELLAVHTDPKGDFYFFGHSLGALIAYEFCVALKDAGRKLPARLFLSGCSAPVAHAGDFIHELHGDDFLDAVINFSGDSPEVLGKRAVIEHNYNLLKHDIKVLENYQPKQETIDVPLTAIFGLQDPLAPLEGVQKWRAISTKGFEMVELDGGHQLLQQHLGTITAIIRDTIAQRSPKGVENINHH